MKKKWVAVPVMLMLMMTGAVLAACSDKEPAEESAGRVLHVSADGNDETGDGSAERPFATPAYAATQAEPGTEVIVHGGKYGQFELDGEASGAESDPVVIRAAEGEEVVIESTPGNAEADENSIGIHLVNVENITIDGIEVTGGTHGIYYESLPDRDDVLDGFRSLKEGKGSSFVPDEEYIKIYESLEN